MKLNEITHFQKQSGSELILYLDQFKKIADNKNYVHFFQTFGKDFSKYLIDNEAGVIFYKEYLLLIVENGFTCHNVCSSVVLGSHTYDQIYGFCDVYENTTYSHTIQHSFLLDKNTNKIIDPIFQFHMFDIEGREHFFFKNYFGVVLSRSLIKEFISPEAEKVYENISGVLKKEVFPFDNKYGNFAELLKKTAHN